MLSTHEKKEEENQYVTSKSPVFDTDDLSYFHFMGLGLRHVELEQGISEAQNGNFRGDAVSLANYGSSEINKHPEFNLTTCVRFQRKVEEFIQQSFSMFHGAYNHFNDAAFSLLIRGEDARMPYDFGNYPLGKCGTQAFSAHQVVSLMRTDGYHNEDINHAVQNTLINLKEVCRQLKLQKAIALSKQLKEKLDTNPNSTIQRLYDLTITMITHYKSNVFIEQPIFLQIATFITSFIENNYIPDENQITELAAQINAIDTNKKKGEDSIHIIYIPTDFSKLNPQELNEKLIECIKNENLKNVQECLKRMEKNSFTSTSSSPLITAAQHKDLNILKAIYEFNPQEYDRIIESTNLETPLFSAVRDGNLENSKYLLEQRKIVPRDLIFNKEHILSKLAIFRHPEMYDLMQLLIEKGITIGDSIKDPRHYPLAQHVLSACRTDAGLKSFKLLLPLSDSKAKYKSIYRISEELSYCYSDDPDWTVLLDLRRIVIQSLTENERLEIQNKFFPKDPDTLFAEPDPFEKAFGYSLHKKQENPPLDELLEKESNKNTQNPIRTKEIFAFFSIAGFTTTKTAEPATSQQAPIAPPIDNEPLLHPTSSEAILVQNLKNRIDELGIYAKVLKDEGVNKGQVGFILANQLKAHANEFFTDKFFALPKEEQKVKFEKFSNKFSAILISQNEIMSVYRKNWKTLRANILIALSIIGLFAIAGKLAYSKYNQGRFLLWKSADKTTSEQKIEAINNSMKNINNLLY